MLDRINQCSFQLFDSEDIFPSIFQIINYESQRDILSRIVELVTYKSTVNKNNPIFWIIFPSYCKILPDIQVEAKLLADSLTKIIKATDGDLAIGQLYTSLEKLASNSPDFATSLYNEFLSHLDSPVAELTINILLGIANTSLKKAHDLACKMANYDNLIQQKIGIISLSRFKYNNSNKSHDLLRITLEIFKSFQTITNPETDYILAKAYGNLVDQSEEAIQALIEFSLKPDLTVKAQIAQILHLKAEKIYTQLWYKKTLFNLIQSPLPSCQILEHLDWCIVRYSKDKPKTTLKFIKKLSINWNYQNKKQPKELPDIFNSTLLELHNHHRDIFQDRLTWWLASNNWHLHLTTWKVISYFNNTPTKINDNETITEAIKRKIFCTSRLILSKRILDRLDEQTVEYVILRIAGYFPDAYSLIALLLSVLSRRQNSPKIINLVTDLLADYVLYNYPGNGGDILNYYLNHEHISNISREVIEAALERSNSYFEARQKLPYLKELQSSSQRAYLFRLAEWKYKNSIIEQARQRSVFSFICPEKPLKYGKAFSIQQNGKFTDPIKLSAFHHEEEIPQGELIDPVGQTIQRMNWRNIGL